MVAKINCPNLRDIRRRGVVYMSTLSACFKVERVLFLNMFGVLSAEVSSGQFLVQCVLEILYGRK